MMAMLQVLIKDGAGCDTCDTEDSSSDGDIWAVMTLAESNNIQMNSCTDSDYVLYCSLLLAACCCPCTRAVGHPYCVRLLME